MALNSRGELKGEGLLPGSRGPSLSGRDRRAGENARAARRLVAEGVGGGGGRGGHLAGATQVSIMELPHQLLVLHGQALVYLGLLMKGLLQHSLLCGQLSVVQQHNTHKLDMNIKIFIITAVNLFI